MSLRTRARRLAVTAGGGCLVAATIAAPASADVNTYVCQVSCTVTVNTALLAAAPEAPGSPTTGAEAISGSNGSSATGFGSLGTVSNQLTGATTVASASSGPTGTSVDQAGRVIDQFPNQTGESAGASSSDSGSSASAGAYRYSVLGSAAGGAAATSSGGTSNSQAGGCVIAISHTEQACIVNSSGADTGGAANQTALQFNNQDVVVTVTTDPNQPVTVSSSVPLTP